MSRLLFEQHLRATSPSLTGSDTPFLDEDAKQVTEFLKGFADGLDDSDDLCTYFDQFCEANEISEDDAGYLQDILIEAAKQASGGEGTDDEINSFLKQLNQPFPKPEKRLPNQDGMTPLSGEGAIKALLQQHPISAFPDPFGNRSFSAEKYKAFDRKANRYGYSYSAANDYNNQKPSRSLANPTINVDTDNKAFEAVDAVGIGAVTHWRVVNKLTNEYVTRQIHKEDAQRIAVDLNQEFVKVLGEAIENPNSSGQGYDASHVHHPLHKTLARHGFEYSHSTPIHTRDGHVQVHHTWVHGEHKVGAYANDHAWNSKVSSASDHSKSGKGAGELAQHLANKAKRYPELKLGETTDFDEVFSTRKHFQDVANTVRAIADPIKRQKMADHHASIFAKQNPRFDHARFHAAAGTTHAVGVKKEGQQAPVASTPITENILKPLDPGREARYLEAFNKQNYTMSGSVVQSGASINHANEWKQTQQMINERKNKFGEDRLVSSELDVIRSVSKRDRENNDHSTGRLDNTFPAISHTRNKHRRWLC
jgi:hypothetical protein